MAANAFALPAASGGQWKPPQWSKPAMVLVTVPAGSTTTVPPPSDVPSVNGVYTISTTATAATSYVFDAVLALEHDQTLTKTHHPVQTGAAVSSHAYIEPAQLILYVLMSDVSASYTTGGNQTTAPYIQAWTGNSSKSVSAYQQMLKLQTLRIPLTVTTRLRTYTNMLIMKVSPREDDKTITGARFRLEFEQIFVANTQVNPVSARANDTQSTGLGTVNPSPVPSTTSTQFSVPSSATTNSLSGASTATDVSVPGAGIYSSVPCQYGSGA
jgi:hypothetical protein